MEQFKIAIDKELVQEMPVVTFPGEIVVIDSMLKLNAAIRTLRAAPLVGFDTETRPSFHKGQHHKMALMQLSTNDICFLFRVNKIGIPNKLAEYLSDSACLKVGLSTGDDFRQLSRVCSATPAGFVELQQLVGKYHISDISLQKVYAILFQQKISKGQRLTNWESPELTHAQQQYAAIDAWACIKIYEYLNSGQFVPELSPYIIKETEDGKEE